MEAVIILEQMVLENALLNVPEVNNHLLFILIAALPDQWVPAIFLNHEFGVTKFVLDIASVLDYHFFHSVDARLVESCERLGPNRESAAHKNVFSHGM
jgi:hypothetical protein